MAVPIGKVISVDLNEEMKHSYLDYAMSVIVGRALPDVRDGLKPVHRRIIYAMHELGMTPDKQHRKSANVVGYVLQKFHPHGDVSVYDALVRLAQDFVCRYPLVDGHGNFGSVDGDAAAAMRYTEARMAKITQLMLADIDKETVDFAPNYDDTTKEPVILTARIPQLLINGSSGIAVGMATNIPPHNLGEVINGAIRMINHPDCTVEDLRQEIKGPDFPTGGRIMGISGIKEAYKNGRGVIKIQAKTNFEELSHGKTAIIVTEIPYMVNKARLIEKIAELVKEKKIEGITDLRDESDRRGMRIVIELRRDAVPQVILNKLYKHTQMQESFGVIMLALVDGQPQVLNLQQIISLYLKHQKEVITRRTSFDLNKNLARAHIVEGLRLALAHIDAVIETIRSSKTPEIAKNALTAKFNLTVSQAGAILDMRLQRLTGLEQEKLEQEYKELQEKIAYFQAVLADEQNVLNIIKEELIAIRNKFSDSRRTEILNEEINMELEDLIPAEEEVITITNQGYIKRLSLNTYRNQKRGGRGVTAMGTKEEDFVRHLFIANTHHHVLFLTNKGKSYRLKVHEITEASRLARGTPIFNLLKFEPGEKITTVIPVVEFTLGKYIFMATRFGLVKKTPLESFKNSRRDGIIAVSLKPGDSLIGAKMTDGNQEIVLGTRRGLVIRFSEKEVPAHGRTSRGVKGVTLKEGDIVVSMDVAQPKASLLAVTANGYGKCTTLKKYRLQSRGGKGLISIRNNVRNGPVVAFLVASPDEEIMLISAEGIVLRMKTTEINLTSRITRGVILMRLAANDKIVDVTRVEKD
ncbi:DNA gyrase subunit A [Peptococcaceae bacterium SCADC1_2_3]|nr:DNA gyrase subunit A [Peptococcaceae bacterium SCADC1_2_3]KFI35813.1 DNA gyrase subunit A [Peptococcaceae bacterium SCADC1_2_3]KFI37533.1 DNA gyrase subunit A [Peptococcaceae bacterium SCADC1_2_3]HCJ79828.1 DNA gyrase subunit A [Desulfotomaculum sp.]